MVADTDSTQSLLTKLTGEGIRFVGAGLIMFPLGLGTSALVHEVLGFSEQIAGAAAIVVLLASGFYLGRGFVFRSKRLVHQQLPRYLITALSLRAAEYAMFLAFLMVGEINYLVSLTLALTISSALKFLLYRFWVF